MCALVWNNKKCFDTVDVWCKYEEGVVVSVGHCWKQQVIYDTNRDDYLVVELGYNVSDKKMYPYNYNLISVKIQLHTQLEKVCGKLVTNAWQIEVRTHEYCALNIVLIAVKLLTAAGMVDECQWMGFIS